MAATPGHWLLAASGHHWLPLTIASDTELVYLVSDCLKVKVTLRPTVSQAWCQAPSGAQDQIFVTARQLRCCRRGAPSLTRGRVGCHGHSQQYM
jgi:hypothetical protein